MIKMPIKSSRIDLSYIYTLGELANQDEPRKKKCFEN